ncbi:YbhB/YbcL family Raf kinase inhibitor-like protein [Olivibacter ginsenosidimutans]|uniref:YbhB/YbcL family Raf kinase inhibitor-like protein n=1 Tax=Olivibacter ginsenosidimutans TaxID=1176537 RepID=A0ABP9ACV5_9SPHI
MKLRSIFEQQEEIPIKYTCLGQNISPHLHIESVPEQTQSFVLLIEDVDAEPIPWRHWHVFNIPASTTSIQEGQVPQGGVEGLCNNHTFGYEGPCPKYFKGTHHYRFRLYAVDTLLALPPASEPEEVLQQMDGHVLAVAELMGTCTSDK